MIHVTHEDVVLQQQQIGAIMTIVIKNVEKELELKLAIMTEEIVEQLLKQKLAQPQNVAEVPAEVLGRQTGNVSELL